jgi:hypothetical protein
MFVSALRVVEEIACGGYFRIQKAEFRKGGVCKGVDEGAWACEN